MVTYFTGLDGSFSDRVVRRLHKVIKDSTAFNLRTWLYAIGQGFARLTLSTASNQLYVDKATGYSLDAWGELYLLPRSVGESDANYRLRILANNINSGGDTASGIATKLSNATGLSFSVVPGSQYVIPNDDWQRVWNAGLYGDFDPSDPNTGTPITPQGYFECGAYGPAGLVAKTTSDFNSSSWMKATQILLNSVTPGVAWDITWGNLSAPPRNEFGLRDWRMIQVVPDEVVSLSILPLFMQPIPSGSITSFSVQTPAPSGRWGTGSVWGDALWD
jgi:hypothetical protein